MNAYEIVCLVLRAQLKYVSAVLMLVLIGRILELDCTAACSWEEGENNAKSCHWLRSKPIWYSHEWLSPTAGKPTVNQFCSQWKTPERIYSRDKGLTKNCKQIFRKKGMLSSKCKIKYKSTWKSPKCACLSNKKSREEQELIETGSTQGETAAVALHISPLS